MPEPKMTNLQKGSKVWVEDRDSAWVAAEVADFAGKQVWVATAAGKKVLALPEKLHSRDADDEEHNGVDDMTKLTYLNEPEVLYNLERRYALNDIYTSLIRPLEMSLRSKRAIRVRLMLLTKDGASHIAFSRTFAGYLK